MSRPSVEIIGIYRVPLTEDLYDKAYKTKYEGVFVPFWRKGKIKKALKEELASIALIEILVKNPDGKFDASSFGQPDTDQAPYDEVYLNLEGTEIISRGFDTPKTAEFRMAFYLHFFDPAKTLKTSYGELVCPDIREIPDRLKKITSYEPAG